MPVARFTRVPGRLYQPGPGATALTGVALLAMAYLALTSPSAIENPAAVAVTAIATGLAVASFVGPLLGLRGRIVVAKRERLEATGHRLEHLLGEVARTVDAGDRSQADGIEKQLSSLVAERDLIDRVPTWPWSPGTFRGFVTALVLPIGLWLTYRVLGQVMT